MVKVSSRTELTACDRDSPRAVRAHLLRVPVRHRGMHAPNISEEKSPSGPSLRTEVKPEEAKGLGERATHTPWGTEGACDDPD